MMLLAAAVALSTAPPFDVTAEGFWFKKYSIPTVYCTKSIAVEFSDLRRALPLLERCGAPSKTDLDRISTTCRLPLDSAEQLVRGLKERGRLVEFSQNCPKIEEFPELDFKHEILSREVSKVQLSTSAFPGITGLLEAQLGTLEWLRKRRDQAAPVLLAVAVGRPPKEGVIRAPPAGVSDYLQMPPDAVQWHPWARSAYVPCQQVDYVYSEFDAPAGSKDEVKILAAARALGEPYIDDDCELTRTFKPLAVVLSSKPLKDIREKMLALPGLRKWSKNHRRQFAKAIPDDQKAKILTEELAAAEALLRDAPAVSALIRAELNRLRPNAAGVSRLRRGTLIYFRRTDSPR